MRAGFSCQSPNAAPAHAASDSQKPGNSNPRPIHHDPDQSASLQLMKICPTRDGGGWSAYLYVAVGLFAVKSFWLSCGWSAWCWTRRCSPGQPYLDYCLVLPDQNRRSDLAGPCASLQVRTRGSCRSRLTQLFGCRKPVLLGGTIVDVVLGQIKQLVYGSKTAIGSAVIIPSNVVVAVVLVVKSIRRYG